MTNAEAWFNNSLRPRKPEGSLGRTAQDGHLDSHTAPELGCFYSHVSTQTFRRALTVSVDMQLREDKGCPSSDVTKSGRVWRKVPESDARSVGLSQSITQHKLTGSKNSAHMSLLYLFLSLAVRSCLRTSEKKIKKITWVQIQQTRELISA